MITNERLAELQREAELGTLTTGGGRGISGKEVIELINVYREHRAGALLGPSLTYEVRDELADFPRRGLAAQQAVDEAIAARTTVDTARLRPRRQAMREGLTQADREAAAAKNRKGSSRS
jgi:hypothetical protein